MKIAIIGAAGRTGLALTTQALARGHHVVAVCRESSVDALAAVARDARCSVMSAPVIADDAFLTRALAGCDAVVAVLISVRRLKATSLVSALRKAAASNDVARVVFTGGEATVLPEPGDTPTRRQRLMMTALPFVSALTPYSMADMIKASTLVRQGDWNWTIVRAPTLNDGTDTDYAVGALHDVTGKHALSRAAYAACLLDALNTDDAIRRTLTVLPA